MRLPGGETVRRGTSTDICWLDAIAMLGRRRRGESARGERRHAYQLLARVPRAIGPRSGKLGLAQLVVDVTVTTASGPATLVDGYTYTLPRR